MLGLVVIPPTSTAAEQGAIGVVFRSAKQQQAALAAASGGAGTKPSSSSSAAAFLGGQAKQAMGDLFGISKWMGDDVDEWVTAAVDGLRKALLTGKEGLHTWGGAVPICDKWVCMTPTPSPHPFPMQG